MLLYCTQICFGECTHGGEQNISGTGGFLKVGTDGSTLTCMMIQFPTPYPPQPSSSAISSLHHDAILFDFLTLFILVKLTIIYAHKELGNKWTIINNEIQHHMNTGKLMGQV